MKKGLLIFVIALTAYPQRAVINGKGSQQEQNRQAREQYSRLTANPARDPWQMPAQVVAALGLKPTEVVATVGDGDGYFSRRMAAAAGQIYVVDKNPAVLSTANKEAPAPVVTITGTPLNLTARARGVDTIFVYNTLDQIPDRVAYFQTLSSVLNANGRLVVIDFYKGTPPAGLPPGQRVTEASITQELSSAGFHLLQRFDFLPYQFFVIFQR